MIENPLEIFNKSFENAKLCAQQNNWELAYQHLNAAKEVSNLWAIEQDRNFIRLAAETAANQNHYREAIEYYRELLQNQLTPFERSTIYLELCRLYRVLVQMKNARLELQRSFQMIGLAYPKKSFFITFIKFFRFLFSFFYLKPSKAIKPNVQIEHQVELYEEAGLSAYYLREITPLFQCIFAVKPLVYQLGPGTKMMDWLGGSAVVMALVGQKSLTQKLIGNMGTIVQQVGSPSIKAKVNLWKALIFDYQGKPLKSAESFELCLNQAEHLSLQDRRLVATTLLGNLNMRGDYTKALSIFRLIKIQLNELKNIHSWSGYSHFDWHALPALSANNQREQVQNIIDSTKAIYSATDDESWLITQYLGNLLLHIYHQKDWQNPIIEDCYERFQAVQLSPQKTHHEACHYWVAKALVEFNRFQAGIIPEQQFLSAHHLLRKCPSHPNIKAFSFYLSALHQNHLKRNYAFNWKRAFQYAYPHKNIHVLKGLLLLACPTVEKECGNIKKLLSGKHNEFQTSG